MATFAFGPMAHSMLVRLHVDDAGIAQLAQAVDVDLKLQRLAQARGPSASTLLHRLAATARRAEKSTRRRPRLLDEGGRGSVG